MRILLKNKLIFNNYLKLLIEGNQFVYIDIGARGGLEDPWKSLPNGLLKVIGFEPNREECERLNRNNSNSKFFPLILWSTRTKKKIYITKNPYCSSVYSPNIQLIKKYQEKHWKLRSVQNIENYQADTLDNVLLNNGLECDFIKIDTQGAEYEIIKGAANTLRKQAPGILVETWIEKVYKGQKLTWDILLLMSDLGYELYDINVAAAWRKDTGNNQIFGRQKIIGLDLLFFKKNFNFSPNLKGFQELIKTVALMEIYGFPDFAVKLIDENLSKYKKNKEDLYKIKTMLTQNSSLISRLKYEILNKLGNILMIKVDNYASLHY